MNILILTHEFPPNGGGVGRAAAALTAELQRRNHTISLLTCRYAHAPPETGDSGVRLHTVWGTRRSELDNNLLPTFLSFIIGGFFKAIGIIRSDRIDVIHCFMSVPAGIIGVLLKLLYGKKLIVSMHGSDVPFHRGERHLFLLRFLIREVWKRADGVTAVSCALRATSQRTWNRAVEQVTVIPNGIDPVYTAELLPHRPSAGRGLRLITVARLHRLKGIQDVIDALHLLKKQESRYTYTYTIAGNGPYEKELADRIGKLDMQSDVSMTGYLSAATIKEAYSRSDVFILTSYCEAFPLVLVEAMYSGLPVIASTAGGIPEVVTAETGVLVEPGATERIAEAINTMNNRYASCSPEAIRHHVRNFTWSTIAEKYLDLYSKA